MQTQEFFAALWRDYVMLAPQADAIRALFGAERVVNDHVAFRTFAHPAISIAVLEQPLLEMGYRRDAPYSFSDKHLSAWGYVPAVPGEPLIFLSQLHYDQLPNLAADIIEELLAHLSHPTVTGAEVFYSGRHWPQLNREQYQTLASVSEYAAWLAVHGFHANHFTIAVHTLGVSIQNVVSKIVSEGYPMNEAGGLIKGTPDDLLVQAATMAPNIEIELADGQCLAVPGCYYEFAQRYVDERGELFQGFVANNANRIFESTHRTNDMMS
ncbi:DUF1338 domain-containing protein [Chitinibacter bivalviorum]|uniref:2-oxoadipate dioxygenase/decarboxylase n=1 Tax=Chitinibacter bivalviorum TaxID=2739434 RepID=A0A7H9BGA9_9NEIS|nr:DUF1338 domain-containing protein [Chitinibacter bivalviorum]QLG87462.1 DUF1338 domain-containing protein [Chitinibacter bivalviorum]